MGSNPTPGTKLDTKAAAMMTSQRCVPSAMAATLTASIDSAAAGENGDGGLHAIDAVPIPQTARACLCSPGVRVGWATLGMATAARLG